MLYSLATEIVNWRVFFPEREIFISRDWDDISYGPSGISCVDATSSRAEWNCSSVTFCRDKF